jgi:hypothetical protein
MRENLEFDSGQKGRNFVIAMAAEMSALGHVWTAHWQELSDVACHSCRVL